MTCVTLKRPIEVLGSPHMMEHEPMAKRKRCGASFFPTTPPGSRFGRGGLGSPSSPFSGSVGGAMSRSAKRAKRRLEVDDCDSLPGADSPPPVSSFLNATPALSSDKLVLQLSQELKRLQRRKAMTSGEGSSSQNSSSTGSGNGPGSPGNSKEQPLFTLKQVTTVCQRMLKEREEQIREDYDKVLASKLAEQYDAFVKFSHDQVERRLAESAFSYVS